MPALPGIHAGLPERNRIAVAGIVVISTVGAARHGKGERMTQGPPAGPPEGWQPPQQQPGWGPPQSAQQPPQGPQPAWGQQPTQTQWGPPQQPQRRKLSGCLTFAIIIVGILVVAGIIGALTGEPPQETPATGGTAASPEPETTVPPSKTRLPALARDGKFEFTVRSFRCSGSTCKAQVAVVNIGDEAQTMFAANQYLYDTDGRRFEADSVASSDSLFLSDLNPGLTASGTIVWKVPTGFKADHLELHDSAFSGGAEVKL